MVPVEAPRNPNVALAPAPRAPLYPTLVAVTLDPLEVIVAFHAELTVCPLANVQRIVQPEIGALPAVTFTVAWKPPVHCPATVYVALQAAVPLLELLEPVVPLDVAVLELLELLLLVLLLLLLLLDELVLDEPFWPRLPGTDCSAEYQTAAILSYPLALGCTPSTRSETLSAEYMFTRWTCLPADARADTMPGICAL